MEDCNRTPYCKNCDKNEKPTSRSCTVYRREQEIIKIKVDEGLTYTEAREAHQTRVTSSKGTFASIVQQRIPNSNTPGYEMNELKQQLMQREMENKTLIAENEKLRNEMTKLQKTMSKLTETTKQLQTQIRQQMHLSNQEDLFVIPKNVARKQPSRQAAPESKIQTRQQTRSDFYQDSRTDKPYSSSETETHTNNKKRSVSSPPKKSAKFSQHSRNSQSDNPSKTQASADEMISEEEM